MIGERFAFASREKSVISSRVQQPLNERQRFLTGLEEKILLFEFTNLPRSGP